ncbi:MAG: hypothetical protein GXO02_05895, partial [Epsilonproteobacteria bacterium]|nr:hypothetical protein [Campylobacterota bacterium]
RKFFPKDFYKKAVGVVLIILIVAIGSHYYFLNKRINEVKEAFLSSKEILCENRVSRIGARSIVVKKGTAGWKIKDDFFISPQYSKKFFMGRCILK